MKYYFVFNPLAGKGGAKEVLESEIAALPEKDSCTIYETKAPLDASEFVKKTCLENPDEALRFIACGGDGTINEVFSGAIGFENASVSCWPCGSGNDFVKIFGGPDAFADVAGILSAPERTLDVMKVGDRYSINVTNFGFDTTVAMTVNEDRAKNGHGSKSSYAKGIVKALLKSMNNKCTVKCDGKVINPDGSLLLCTLSNGQYVGGSFNCAPRGEIDDGLIEVCLVKPISRIRFFKMLTPYTNGEHLDREDFKDVMTYLRAKKIEMSAPEGFAYSLDGEIIHESEFTVEIVPGALKLAVPEKK